MSLPENIFSTAFRHQRLGLMFSVVMIITVYIASIALISSSALSGATAIIERNIGGRATIEIPASSGGNTMTEKERNEKIIPILSSAPEIEKIEPVQMSETAVLLDPWISDKTALNSLPLPTLIDIQIKPGEKLDIEALHEKLSRTIPGVHVDAHSDWMNRLLLIVRSLGIVAWIVIIVTFITLSITINLSCRTALAVQHDTIELLHVMGANDPDIAKHFQRHVLKISWPSAMAGYCLAIATAGIVITLLISFIEHPIPQTPRELWLSALYSLLVPVVAILGAGVSARFFVMSYLKELP